MAECTFPVSPRWPLPQRTNNNSIRTDIGGWHYGSKAPMFLLWHMLVSNSAFHYHLQFTCTAYISHGLCNRFCILNTYTNSDPLNLHVPPIPHPAEQRNELYLTRSVLHPLGPVDRDCREWQRLVKFLGNYRGVCACVGVWDVRSFLFLFLFLFLLFLLLSNWTFFVSAIGDGYEMIKIRLPSTRHDIGTEGS